MDLPKLEDRQRRGDLIEVFKILQGLENINQNNFFQTNTTNTRGHSKHLYKLRCNKTQTKNSFRHRIVNEWNTLPEHVVSATSINTFKKRFDQHTHQMEMEAGNRIYVDHYGTREIYW